MLILLPLAFLAFVSIILTGLVLWRPRIGIAWFVSTIAVFITWLMILYLRFRLPETFSIGIREVPGNISFSARLLSDNISWPLAWALSASLLTFTVVFAIRLSTKEVNRFSSSSLPASLIFGSLGLWAIFSGNFNNLILAWAAIDLVWLLLMLMSSQDHQAILITFAIRGFGLFLAIGASIAQQPGVPPIFPIVDTTAYSWIFLGAVIRLGSIAFSGRIFETANSNQDFHLFVNLVVAASAIIAVIRGSDGNSSGMGTILLGLTGFLALIYGIIWLALNPETGRFWSWIMGVSALSVIAALTGEEQASLAWGIVVILPGSLLLYTHYRPRFSAFWWLAGIMMLSTLPFTPAWQGIRIYPLPGQVFNQGVGWIVWLLAQTLLFTGYVIAMRKSRLTLPGPDRWVEIVYPIGLIFLPLTHIIILLFGVPGLTNDLKGFPALSLSVYSLASLALAVAGSLLVKQYSAKITRAAYLIRTITPYQWVTRVIGSMFRAISQFSSLVDRILEGEGGILWTFLFVILLFALWFQFGAGG